MKHRFLPLLAALAGLVCFGTPAAAQIDSTVNRLPVTATFRFDTGKAGQTADLSHPAYFSLSYVDVGSNLAYAGTKTINSCTHTAFQPASQDAAAGDNNAIRFMVKTKTGITFTPSKVSFVTTRHGTDGGKLDISWLNADGSKTSLETGVAPNRNNATPPYTEWSYTFTEGKASMGESGLVVNLYSLGSTKQVSLYNVVLEGYLDGRMADIATYSVGTEARPEGAGIINVSPLGTVFDDGTDITLSQERQFGYRFVQWTDAQGNPLGRDADGLKFTLTGDTLIVAQYEAIPTYELKTVLTNGAADYMLTYSPTPTTVGGRLMYEEDTRVSVTASGNAILSFGSWSDGTTAATTSVLMDADRELTANYMALDYIAGWDFYNAGNNARRADFAAEENDADALILRKEDGTTSGWLDKSNSQGGQFGRNCGVSWKNYQDLYYWQTQVNAEAFTDIKVRSALAYQYNTYKTWNVEWSADGSQWQTAGTVYLGRQQTWADSTFSLPSEADHCKTLYIRWKQDTSSEVAGTSGSNDGITIAGIYIYGEANALDDGKAPQLVSSVPAEGAANASASGQIVLTFDKKVELTDSARATLNGQALMLTVQGKTVTATYKGLDYSTACTFVLAANSLTDRSGNCYGEDLILNFSTRSLPGIDKKLYDFVVPDDGSFEDAIKKASARSDKSVRYRIFVKKGSYRLEGDAGATVTGSDNKSYRKPTTSISTPNLSIIGEDMDATELYNYHEAFAKIEGLRKADCIALSSAAKSTYVQDISFRNGCSWSTNGNGDGRCCALSDAGDKNIFKNFKMVAWQDSYLSDNAGGRFYFEDCELHGAVDYLCGKGDALYNRCNLVIERDGVPLCAPSTPKQYGYVFLDCEVNSANKTYYKNFTLGRPWGSGTPSAIYINLMVNNGLNLSSDGWSEMSGGYPKRFAEYGTHTPSGTFIDLANRKKTFGDGYSNNPVLTQAEAATYTVETVMGSTDSWDPTLYTEQAQAPVIAFADSALCWENSDYVLLYAIVRNDSVVDFTKRSTYAIVPKAGDRWSVRAANEMGGLGLPSNVLYIDDQGQVVDQLQAPGQASVVSVRYFTLDGREVIAPVQGINVVCSRLDDGSLRTEKLLVK